MKGHNSCGVCALGRIWEDRSMEFWQQCLAELFGRRIVVVAIFSSEV
jgi:hypothetical protein